VEGTNTVNSVTSSNFTTAFGHSRVNTGWTVGSGIEGKLLIPGWTLKAEYLYLDLGTLDATTPGVSFTFGTTPPFTFGVTGGGVSTHTHFTDNIVRVGLNYQFH
jgi:outer membrane immunogenic protein